MGNPKDFGIGVQIFQWYGYNDINLHGDMEKFIFRRKKMNQRCKIELSGINRKYYLVPVSFPDLPSYSPRIPLLLSLIALKSFY